MTGIQALLLFAAATAASGMAALPRAARAPWLINETPSVPRGLYRRTPAAPQPGTVVAVTPPTSARRYLSTLGAPADARLLKHVAAGPGDTVCRHGRRLTWARGEAVAMARDRRGRALPVWRGCRRLGSDELLVIGDSPASFDSRYFGPIRRTAIEGVYREAWRW
jgi:type IV secretory pathway protease TraF